VRLRPPDSITEPHELTVSLERPPPPDAGVGWLQPFVLLILLVSVLAALRRRRRRRKFGQQGLRTLVTGAAVGNLLVDLGSILMPNRPTTEVMRQLEDEPATDDVGDRRDPPPMNP